MEEVSITNPDNLYVNGLDYWLCSPSSTSSWGLFYVDQAGRVGTVRASFAHSGPKHAIRPVVALKTTATGKQNSDGSWNIE